MEFLKKQPWIVVVVGIILALMFFITRPYNNLVSLDEGVLEKWSQVENQYQRRADLIPNLVEVVKGSAAHEKDTLQAVVEARAGATKTNINVKDAQEMAAFQKQQTGLSSALSRLMVVVEKYPDLKANQNFRDLQVQLEGTENRITVARKDYNEEVKDYNTVVRQFPSNMTAKVFGFEKAERFKAEEGSEKAPEVKF